MKFLLLVLSLMLFATSSFAKKKLDTDFTDVNDWVQFERVMQEAEWRDRQVGWSYLLSGALVSIGGTIGAESTTDTGAKLIYGLSASFGLGAAGYGALRLINGNDYTIFYNTLRRSSLTPAQRDELVRHYMEQNRERERTIRIARIVSHILIGGMNFYSASREDDKNTKTFFQFLGTANLAIALAYTF